MNLAQFKWRTARFALGVSLAAISLASAIAPAQARHWRHHHYAHHYHYRHYARHFNARHSAAPAGPAFAAIVVDENSGRTLYSANENALRHPASLTKVMTLYMLFEKLDSGELTLQSSIPISEHAAEQSPSKLGIDAGQSLSVENAIKAVVTRSANDVAVAIGEKIGEDEDSFSQMMTRKAHALGMANTVFVNASGLPADAQVTTAHDLSLLARAIQERFPRYFHYFSTTEFTYNGEVIGNHNRLLGRVDGVDGIKTGYTRASGFNLLTSVHRDGRSLVAVVLGGRTSGERDRTMAGLIGREIASASTTHTATMVAENRVSAEPVKVAAADIPARPAQEPLNLTPPAALTQKAAPIVVASSAPLPVARAALQRANEGEGDNVAADDANVSKPLKRALLASAQKFVALDVTPPAAPLRSVDKSPAELGWVKGPDGQRGKPIVLASLSASPIVTPPQRPKEESVVSQNDAPAAHTHDGWVIQIGATSDAGKANDLLIKARAQNHTTLASAQPFTEKFQKGEDVFYRARFAGLDSNAAESACKSLKRNGFSCFTSRQ